jgi:phosphatidylinositol alpha-1,6-mannosyltransferase
LLVWLWSLDLLSGPRKLRKERQELIFVMTGACATPGGIAAENRHTLRVLAQLTLKHSLRLTVLSFLERDIDRAPFLPATVMFRGFTGSKFRLAVAIWRQVLARPLFVFDHVTLAKPLLPLIVMHGIRPVIFAHGSESWKRIRRVNRWLFANAMLVLTNSQFTLRKMRERMPRFNGVACPLGLAPEIELNSRPPDALTEPLSFASADGEMRLLGERVCLLVGRMHPREREKGHYELLQVWPEIIREFGNAQLVFAGPGDDRTNIARVACERGVGDSVFVVGELPPGVLRSLHTTCYAFTMPSKQEGFGLVYLEAMNAGKPCLGCRDDGAEDVIVDEETGLLVSNPKDRDELLAALRRLLSNPEASREMGHRGFERLTKHFTAAQFQQRLREQFVKLL